MSSATHAQADSKPHLVVLTTGELFHVPLAPTLGKRWQARRPQANGNSMFVKTFDSLALAMIGARFNHAASWACLLAIHYRQQQDYHRRAQSITIREFARVTGYQLSTVQLALAELKKRGMVEVTRGQARKDASSYKLTHHSRWRT